MDTRCLIQAVSGRIGRYERAVNKLLQHRWFMGNDECCLRILLITPAILCISSLVTRQMHKQSGGIKATHIETTPLHINSRQNYRVIQWFSGQVTLIPPAKNSSLASHSTAQLFTAPRLSAHVNDDDDLLVMNCTRLSLSFFHFVRKGESTNEATLILECCVTVYKSVCLSKKNCAPPIQDCYICMYGSSINIVLACHCYYHLSSKNSASLTFGHPFTQIGVIVSF